MKRIWLILITALILCLFALPAEAQGKWAYRLDDRELAHITAYDDASAFYVKIPQKIDGYWVAGIDSGAFQNATALESVQFPITVTAIAPDAFYDPQKITIRAYNGSAALRYAKANGIRTNNLSDLYFTESVVDLSEIARNDYSYINNGVRLPKAYAALLQEGALFFLPADETHSLGDGYQVRSVKEDGDCIEIAMAEAAPDLILTRVHLELSNLTADMGRAVALTEDVQIKRSGATISGASKTIGIEYRNNILTASGSVDFTLDYLNLDISMAPFTVNNFEYEVSVGGEMKIGLTGKLEKEIPLVRVPFYGVPDVADIYATISIDLEAEGGVQLTIDLGCDANAGYTPETGWISSVNGHGSVQPNAGVNVTATLNLPKFAICVPVIGDVAVVAAEIIAEADVQSAYDIRYADTLTCVDLDVKIKGRPNIWIGIDAEIGQFEIENKLSYIPFEVELFEDSWHIEDWKVLKECSYLGSWLYFDTDCEIEIPPEHCNTGRYYITYDYLSIKRANHTFLGWYTLPQGSPDAVRLSGYIEVPQKGRTVYAHWEEDRYEGDYTMDEIIPPVGTFLDDCWMGIDSKLGEFSRISKYESYAPYPSLSDFLEYNKNAHPKPEAKDYRTDWRGVSHNSPGSNVSSRSWAEGYVATDGDRYNKNLIRISFPSTMEYIGYYENCENLQYVDMSKMKIANIHSSETFENLPNLETVLLPYQLESIPSLFLSGTKSLKHINIPSTCTYIGYSAFEGSGLTECPLQEGVKELGFWAFRDCDSLTEVTIPASINHIENIEDDDFGVFMDCDNLETVAYADGSTIAVSGFANCPKLKTVHLDPQQINIQQGTFKNCISLSQINFDAPQINVGRNAFLNCYSLKDVTGDFSFIGISAFENTTGLETVNLTGDVLVISENAFKGSGVKTVNIRCNQLVIEYNSFVNCSRLTELSIEADTVWFNGFAPFNQCKNLEKVSISAPGGGSVDGFRNCEKLTNVSLSGSFSLGDQAFKNCPITVLTLDLTNFDLNGFNNCALLEKVQITGSLNNVKSYAFENCYALEELTLPGGSGTIEGIRDCKKLKKVTIGEGYTEIAGSAFSGCIALEEIVIPSSVRKISSSAFMNCTNLKTVTILGPNTQIEDGAFWNCPSLEQIDCQEGSASDQFVHAGGAIVGPQSAASLILSFKSNINLEIGDMHVKAGQSVSLNAPYPTQGYEFIGFFTDEYFLTAAQNPFIMPDSDTTIYLRYDMVYVPHDPSYTEENNVLTWYNGEGYFSMHNVYAIGPGAIGPNVTKMRIALWTWEAQDGAFVKATNLEEFTVEIGNEKFYAQDGVLYRYDGTLVSCPAKTKLETLIIPEGITAIAAHAFDWEACETPLREIHIPNSVTTIGAHAFDGIGDGTNVYGPESGPVADAAKKAGLSYNRHKITYIVDGELFGVSACNAGALLPAVATPVKEGAAFLGWSTSIGASPVDLASFTMPNQELALYAVFDGGVPSVWVDLPESLTTLKKGLFAGSAVQAVRCNSALESIGSQAFANCTWLTVVEIPSGRTQIAEDAFDGCNVSSIRIYAPKGSAAQIFAQSHGLIWVDIQAQ